MVTELNALKEAVAALTTKTDGLQENVTDIETVVNQIASGGSSSVIRRIQRGMFSTSSREESAEITLNGFTNIDKMIVILHSKTESSGLSTGNSAYVASLTLNKLTIGCFRSTDGSYQVIEFY